MALWRRFVGVMFSRAMSVTDRLQSLGLEATLNFGAGSEFPICHSSISRPKN